MKPDGTARAEHTAEIERLREDLRLSEARFRDVIERNADAIVVVDAEGTIRFANQEAEKLFTAAAFLRYGVVDSTDTVFGERGAWEMPVNRSGRTRLLRDERVHQ